MNIEINSDIERYIEEQVKSGRFATATEVLQAGIERLMCDDEYEEEERALEEAERQLAAGEVTDLKQFSAEFRREITLSHRRIEATG